MRVDYFDFIADISYYSSCVQTLAKCCDIKSYASADGNQPGDCDLCECYKQTRSLRERIYACAQAASLTTLDIIRLVLSCTCVRFCSAEV